MSKSTGEKLVALLCLGFCIFYGLSATSIDVFPGREAEHITSRTFPYLLTAIGAICSLAILIGALRTTESEGSAAGGGPYHWARCLALVGVAVVYAVLMTRLGFVVSTIGFIAAGCLLLGERRIGLVISAAVIPPVIFWLLLELGLDIRLPPFNIWRG
ncbi:MAG: tripartite tricarboxylate transporter TctB family protein [Woeseiaceae bacterium]|nr:tripartite tricarboxylate transporter TctB family protein [Woeseiaceae bacterium]